MILIIAAEIPWALVKKFADDTKCYMFVETEEDKTRFQAMFNNLEEWSRDGQMMDKRHVIHAGKQNHEYQYMWDGGILEKAEAEKDVGVMIASNLKPSLQCARAAKKANVVLGQLARRCNLQGQGKLYQAV